MSSELSIECKLARHHTLENIDGSLAYLLIKIIPDTTARIAPLPLNINLVIDVSRSMKGEKIKRACEAAKLLVNSLRSNDWISVVIFSDDARAVVPATVAADKVAICSVIDKIKIVAGTRMSHGMEVGLREMRQAGLINKINRMILLTDGETENEQQCRKIAVQGGDNHIIISSLGVGDKYNEELLTHISDATLGRFYHLKTPQEIDAIIQNEFFDASVSFISNVNLMLNLAEGVKFDSMDRIFPNSVRLQPKSQEEGRLLEVNIGTLKGTEPTILGAQLKLPAKPAGRAMITEVSVNFDIPTMNVDGKIVSSDVFVEYTNDQNLCREVDSEVVNYYNQLNTQKLVEQAIKETREGNIADATRSLSEAQVMTQRLGNLPLATSIQKARNELEQKGTISLDGIKTIKAGSRFTVRIDETQLK